MDKWEYRSHLVWVTESKVDGQKKTVEHWLDELGRQGWEMVGAAADSSNLYRLFFKRRVSA